MRDVNICFRQKNRTQWNSYTIFSLKYVIDVEWPDTINLILGISFSFVFGNSKSGPNNLLYWTPSKRFAVHAEICGLARLSPHIFQRSYHVVHMQSCMIIGINTDTNSKCFENENRNKFRYTIMLFQESNCHTSQKINK